jgi:hypothetical protein
MLLECSNGMLGGIKHVIACNVGLHSFGVLIVHHTECGCIAIHTKVGENISESSNHGSVILGWHGMHKDGSEVVNVCHRHICYVAEQLHWEGTSEAGVHCPSI